jgi:hypothetical protein
MNTKALAIASSVGVIAVAALLFAYPAMAASNAAPQNASYQQPMQKADTNAQRRIQLTVGQTISLSSVAGGYREVGNPSVNGTASGSIDLTVSAGFKGGYAITVTGGSVVINGTTNTISGGSAELGPYGTHMVGQGQAGTAQFLFEAKNLGKFGSTDYGILSIDLGNGSSEFVARLLVTIKA